ncbi:MAG: HAD hydrolase family protein [Phycisphaerae bacterium]|jgi:3-deoxy-D-manno-octulosonate 8-phosphate phosphatase (KDO 8-P phosphatase)
MGAIDYSKIELLVLDVDGVLTDGKIVLGPGGEEIKFFDVRDGAGVKYWKRVGKKVAIISGRSSPAVNLRGAELDADAVVLGAKNKLPAYEQVLKDLRLTDAQTAVIGDDLPDLPLFWRAALSIAPADAVGEVRAAAGHVTVARGGNGAVREVVEMILKQTGLWDQIMARYRRPDKESSS